MKLPVTLEVEYWMTPEGRNLTDLAAFGPNVFTHGMKNAQLRGALSHWQQLQVELDLPEEAVAALRKGLAEGYKPILKLTAVSETGK